MKKHLQIAKKIIVTITILVCSGCLFAQGPWEYYTTQNTGANSLTSNNMYAILADGENNIWFGTREEVTVFDGSDYINYSSFDGLRNGVRVIFEDSQNNYWFGILAAGVSKFNGAYFTNYYQQNSGLNSNNVMEIIEDNENNIWFALNVDSDGSGGGISVFDGTQYWVTYDTTNSELPNNNVHSIIQDNSNNFWIGSDGGLSNFDGTNWVTYTSVDGLVNDTVRTIIQDTLNNIWVGTSNGVGKYDGTSWTTYNMDDGLVNNQITEIIEDSQGNIWFATEIGVSKFDGSIWTTYTREDGLSNNEVRDLAKDEQGNIWFATRFGASKFDGSNWTQYSTHDGGLADNNVWEIIEDVAGNIWFTGFDGVSTFDSTDWTNYSESDGLGENYNWDMIHDSQGNIWFSGSYGNIVTKYDGTDFIQYELDGIFQECIYEDSNGNIWFGSWSGYGAVKYDGTEFIHYTHDDMQRGTVVMSIGQDVDGGMLFATDEGVVKYDGANSSEFLIDNNHDIIEDIHGNIWFGGAYNLFKYDGTDWEVFDINSGLIGYSIYSILATSSDEIWIGTKGGGAVKFNPSFEISLIINSTDDTGDSNPGDGVCDDGTGNCTLRAAIEEANAYPGKDSIAFYISGTGPHTIRPNYALPIIFDPLVIDGTTEPDFQGTPIVELDGSNASNAN